MVHGEHQHSVNDHSIVWPVGTDQRLFTAIDAEYESNEEPTDDESSSNDEHSQEDLSDNNVYCECGNTVGYLVDGHFRTDPDCYRSECDQDGTRWCSDCWELTDSIKKNVTKTSLLRMKMKLNQLFGVNVAISR